MKLQLGIWARNGLLGSKMGWPKKMCSKQCHKPSLVTINGWYKPSNHGIMGYFIFPRKNGGSGLGLVNKLE
jgi:hypothetical protein